MHDFTEFLSEIAPFLMVIAIIWIISRRKLEEKRISATARNSAEKAAQYVSNAKELEERVRVLERIVTDRGYDVSTQIEALRDQQRVEEAVDRKPSRGADMRLDERDRVG